MISSAQSKSGVVCPDLAELRSLSDEQLMSQLRNGGDDALAILFERYHLVVFSIALRILRDRGEAEDVMQSVFLEIYRAMAQYDPAKGTLKVWMLQYAYHRAFNRKKYLNARRFYSQESLEDLNPFSNGELSTTGRYGPGELRRLLHQGLATLGEPQKRVIELASYDGFSMREIAEKTGGTLSEVRHHYYRGLKKLHSFMTQPLAQPQTSNDE